MNAQGFRLQSILDLRASALDDAKNSLQQALQTLASTQLACDQAHQEADAIADRICSAPAAQPASQSQASHQSYLYLTRQALAFQNRVRECQHAVQTCRMEVLRTSREHEILVRLREKWLKAGRYLEDRKEESLLNDLMNAQRFQNLNQSRQEFLQT